MKRSADLLRESNSNLDITNFLKAFARQMKSGYLRGTNYGDAEHESRKQLVYLRRVIDYIRRGDTMVKPWIEEITIHVPAKLCCELHYFFADQEFSRSTTGDLLDILNWIPWTTTIGSSLRVSLKMPRTHWCYLEAPDPSMQLLPRPHRDRPQR